MISPAVPAMSGQFNADSTADLSAPFSEPIQ